jgi:hypothetical protein
MLKYFRKSWKANIHLDSMEEFSVYITENTAGEYRKDQSVNIV